MYKSLYCSKKQRLYYNCLIWHEYVIIRINALTTKMIAAYKDSHESVAVYCLNISFVNRLIRAKVHVNFYFWNSTLRAFPLEHWDSVTQWFIPRCEENPVCLHVFLRGIFMYQNCGFGDMGDTVISESPWFVTSLLFFSLLLLPPPHLPQPAKTLAYGY